MARVDCDYCEIQDIKDYLGAQWTSGVAYDALLGTLVTEASRLIDRETGWGDCHYAAGDATPVASARLFDTVSGYEMEVDRCLQAAAAIAVDETATGVYVAWVLNTDYLLWPYNELYFTRVVISTGAAKVFVDGQQLLQVTGKWGGTTSPPSVIKLATTMTVARWFKEGMQAYQDTGAIIEVGQLVYRKALGPAVKEMLRVTFRKAHYG